MTALDTLDHRLIAILREDGRAPISKIAHVLGVSRTTVQTRIDRLVQSGAILGFTIRAQDVETSSIRAIMLVEVAGRSTDAVIRSLRGIREIHALHTTNGAWDLVAEIVSSSLADFDRVLREVRMTDGVLNSETSILLRSLQ